MRHSIAEYNQGAWAEWRIECEEAMSTAQPEIRVELHDRDTSHRVVPAHWFYHEQADQMLTAAQQGKGALLTALVALLPEGELRYRAGLAQEHFAATGE